MKLLLLEDDIALRRELEWVLRDAGWAVDTVGSLADADLTVVLTAVYIVAPRLLLAYAESDPADSNQRALDAVQ